MRRWSILAAVVGGVLVACPREPTPDQATPSEPASDEAPIGGPARSPVPDAVESCIATAVGDTDRVPALVQGLCAEMVRTHTPGAAVAIAVEDGPSVMVAAGVRCSGESAPVLSQTSFRIGSITKSLVAAAIVAEATKQPWSLDEPVRDHLIGLSSAYRDVTWRQLLNHTAGVSETPAAPEHRGLSPEALAAVLSSAKPRFVAGERYEYANAGYVLLGLAISQRTQTPVVDLLRGVVAVGGADPHPPLDAREHELDTVACGHLLGRPVTVHDDLALLAQGATWSFAAGGVVMSAPDLARVGLRLGTTLHTDETVATKNPPWRYGLGLRRRALASGGEHWLHAGMTGNFAAELHILPDSGVAVAVLANSGAYLRATGFAALAHAAPDVSLGGAP